MNMQYRKPLPSLRMKTKIRGVGPAAFFVTLLAFGCASTPIDSPPLQATNESSPRPPLNLKYAELPVRVKHAGTTRDELYIARYVEEWRKRVERVGTVNYPEEAKGKLSGRLILSVGIRSDGNIERVEIYRSSGHKILDDAAIRIVMMAAPFAPLPPEIRNDFDILVVTQPWTFTATDNPERSNTSPSA